MRCIRVYAFIKIPHSSNGWQITIYPWWWSSKCVWSASHTNEYSEKRYEVYIWGNAGWWWRWKMWWNRGSGSLLIWIMRIKRVCEWMLCYMLHACCAKMKEEHNIKNTQCNSTNGANDADAELWASLSPTSSRLCMWRRWRCGVRFFVFLDCKIWWRWCRFDGISSSRIVAQWVSALQRFLCIFANKWSSHTQTHTFERGNLYKEHEYE